MTKGRGGGSAVDGLEDGRLDFEEAALVEEAADVGDEAGAGAEGVAHFFVGDEVEVTLAVAGLGVGEAVIFLGEGVEGLRDEV